MQCLFFPSFISENTFSNRYVLYFLHKRKITRPHFIQFNQNRFLCENIFLKNFLLPYLYILSIHILFMLMLRFVRQQYIYLYNAFKYFKVFLFSIYRYIYSEGLIGKKKFSIFVKKKKVFQKF